MNHITPQAMERLRSPNLVILEPGEKINIVLDGKAIDQLAPAFIAKLERQEQKKANA